MTKNDNYFHSVGQIPTDTTFDAILVLGGGVPEDIRTPPIYTQERCKVASEVYKALSLPSGSVSSPSSRPPPKILTLSAGTAHLPQALSTDGLPIWESTASAAYLIHELGIPSQDLFVETTSYDTISNAFFARLNFCDIVQWKKLLIITNEFHMGRTKLIFDWIFHAPNGGKNNNGNDDTPYELFYLSVPDVGLSEDAIEARRQKESKSAATVKNHLSQKYKSIEEVFEFLTTEHSFYTASSLVERGMDDGTAQDKVGKLVQDSYGGVSTRLGKGKGGSSLSPLSSPTSFLYGIVVGMGVMALMLLSTKRGSGKRHFL